LRWREEKIRDKLHGAAHMISAKMNKPSKSFNYIHTMIWKNICLAIYLILLLLLQMEKEKEDEVKLNKAPKSFIPILPMIWKIKCLALN